MSLPTLATATTATAVDLASWTRLERSLQRMTPELRALLAPAPACAAHADGPGAAEGEQAGAALSPPTLPAPSLLVDPFPPPATAARRGANVCRRYTSLTNRSGV